MSLPGRGWIWWGPGFLWSTISTCQVVVGSVGCGIGSLVGGGVVTVLYLELLRCVSLAEGYLGVLCYCVSEG